jgi:hypothetical protein
VEIARGQAEKAHPPGQARERAKYEAEVRLLGKWGLATKRQVGISLEWAKTASAGDLDKARGKLVETLFGDAYLDMIGKAREQLEEAGANLD